jgi:hypothetical protein
MAQMLAAALAARGHEVRLACRLRSRDDGARPGRAGRLAAVGRRLADRWPVDRRAAPPDLWFTYHLYWKAPDWIGPAVATRLGIPYVVAEASVAMKRANGPGAEGHAQVLAALARADLAITINPADAAGITPHLARHAQHLDLPPFVAASPAPMPDARATLARALALVPGVPWLAVAAMMRTGDKAASFAVLARSLARLEGRPWLLLIAGDGPAAPAVRAMFEPFGERVRFLGRLGQDEIARLWAAADICPWPAINEAWGMALLEAQATGVPVVAGRIGGVPAIVADGVTGLLAPPGDDIAFAAALDRLLADPALRRRLGAAASAKVAADHTLAIAADRLDRALTALAPP